MIAKLKEAARKLRTETRALLIAARDPRTPWLARLLVVGIVAYAASPIDLIPDFIPVIGYLDDLVLVPAGIILAIKIIPAAVLAESRERANSATETNKPNARIAVAIVIGVWILGATLAAAWIIRSLD